MCVTNGFPQMVTHPSANQAHGYLALLINSNMLPISLTYRASQVGEIQVCMWLLLLVRHSARDES